MSELEMYRGDTVPFFSTAYLADGATPIDLTGAKMYFTAKYDADDVDASAVLALDSSYGGVYIPDPTTGQFFVRIAAAYTNSVLLIDGERTLFYDVQLKNAAGEVYTLEVGTLKIKQDITQRTT